MRRHVFILAVLIIGGAVAVVTAGGDPVRGYALGVFVASRLLARGRMSA